MYVNRDIVTAVKNGEAVTITDPKMRCVYCGEEISPDEAVEVDYIICEDGSVEKWYSCRECAEEDTESAF